MKVYIDRVLQVRPEMNPDLGLPEKVETRPGVTHAPPYLIPEHDLITKAGLRAIEHLLRRDGHLAKGEPFEPVFSA